MSDIYIKCENRSAKLNWNEIQIKTTQKDAYTLKTKLTLDTSIQIQL